MQNYPTIHFDEFCQHTTHSCEEQGFLVIQRQHPEFGCWREKQLDLGHIRIFEHRANLKRNVNVFFSDSTLKDYVHHCMSLAGEMAANFTQHSISANLNSESFHTIYLPSEDYFLGMGTQFTNVHIEIESSYYTELLCDSEKWSAEMKKKIAGKEVHYLGQFKLSLPMTQTIHSIFSSSLSGSLKKLLIEAKVHELVALQLHRSFRMEPGSAAARVGKADLFHAIREHLDQTFLHEHSLRDIARHFGINEFALKKGFKENFQTTVFDYLLTKRLEYSRLLLASTNQSIQHIGLTVGYKHANHFSTSFKKKFGINPSEVRR